jgi:hypothetical protein
LQRGRLALIHAASVLAVFESAERAEQAVHRLCGAEFDAQHHSSLAVIALMALGYALFGLLARWPVPWVPLLIATGINVAQGLSYARLQKTAHGARRDDAGQLLDWLALYLRRHEGNSSPYQRS